MEIRAWFSLGLTTMFFILLLIGAWYVVPIFAGLITNTATAGFVTTGTANFGLGLMYTGLFATIIVSFIFIANKIIKNTEA